MVYAKKLSKCCGRQPLKVWSAKAFHINSNFVKAVFHKIYLVHC